MIHSNIINGKAVAQNILDDLSTKINCLLDKRLAPPKLAAVLVGDDPASQIYVKHKIATCKKVGILSEQHFLHATTKQEELLGLINTLNLDPTVTAILVQLPLPQHISTKNIINAILPTKDVDGFHPYNLGRLAAKDPSIHSCTPKGIMRLIKHYKIETRGKNAVVIGSSMIVGRPMALELLNEDSTVTVCHSQTKNLREFTKEADLLISATGHQHLITKDYVKKGAAIFDVGITRTKNGDITGDVDFAQIKNIAGLITPVPGGVGPMTVAMLMENCWELYVNSNKSTRC